MAGHPPIYSNPKDLNDKIEEYFEQEVKAPTITGLCLFLGFESRQSFYDYANRDGFSYTIKKARLRIENRYETSLTDKDTPTSGVIFALKNLGWSDKQEVDHSSSDGSMTPPTQIVFTKQ